MRAQRTNRRTGFTLVEMLVATALILFIMAIISEAFGAGAQTFRNLRAAGDLQDRLRGAATIARKDLSHDHFGPPYGANHGGPRLRDQRLDQAGWRPPYAGYVQFGQDEQSYFEPGGGQGSPGYPNGMPVPTMADGEGLFSTRARTHWLKFTVRVPEATAPELFSAAYHPSLASQPALNAFPALAPMVYTRWAEVMYYLDFADNKTTSEGMPLGILRRRVRLLPAKSATVVVNAADAVQIAAEVGNKKYPDVIDPIAVGPAPSPPYAAGSVIVLIPGPEAINKQPALRIGEWNVPPSPCVGTNMPAWRAKWVHPTGDDILLTDVISFEVKAAWFNNRSMNAFPLPNGGSSPPADTMLPPPLGQNNTDEPFSDLKLTQLQDGFATFGRRFDTGYEPQPPAIPIDWDNPLNPGNNVAGDPAAGFLIKAIPVQQPVPARINVRALQIKLRIWDWKNEQARQVTLVQEV